jgi:hypothetical protein
VKRRLRLVGGAIHYENLDASGMATDIDRVTWTVDASFELSGANLFAYVVGNHLDNDGAMPDMDQFGIVGQGGYYLTEDWEAFARYEWGDSDTASEEDLSIITVGANYYIAGHALKWTTDVGFALDGVGATWASSGAGWREDASGEDGQVVVRSQIQLVF